MLQEEFKGTLYELLKPIKISHKSNVYEDLREWKRILYKSQSVPNIKELHLGARVYKTINKLKRTRIITFDDIEFLKNVILDLTDKRHLFLKHRISQCAGGFVTFRCYYSGKENRQYILINNKKVYIFKKNVNTTLKK